MPCCTACGVTSPTASRPRKRPTSWLSSTRSRACPTGACCTTACNRAWLPVRAAASTAPCCTWTWTISRTSTTPTAMRWGTACWSRWRSACAPVCARATRSRAWAETSSCCWCSSSMKTWKPPWPRRAGLATRWWRSCHSPVPSVRCSTRAAPAWGCPCFWAMRWAPTNCSSAPTWPCTRPRLPGATRCGFSIRRSRRASMPAPHWRRTCARPCNATSWCCTTSPRWTPRAAVWVWRPWCAGNTRSAGRCSRWTSFRWPRRRG